ncbi:MAG: GspJ family type II secretion system protein [Bdellovibrionaceae bacterium]|nr:GspJ family type II secretion system protein [Pseudobdellovibrionaceae bacterium]
MKDRGFTLIEVLISLMILSTLSLLAAHAIRQGVNAREKVQDQLDDVSRLRDAVRLMQQDIGLAFHFRDFEKEIQDQYKKINTPPGAQSSTPQAPASANPNEAKRQNPETHFDGTEESLNFVTMNNARLVSNVAMADFIEVGYEVRDCRRVAGGSGTCLWRRMSPIVDSDVRRGGDSVVLLEDVSEFKLRYLGPGKKDWDSQWKSTGGADGASRARFPHAVEISIEISRQKEGAQKPKKYSMVVVAPVWFPNNPEGAAHGQTTP